MKFLRDVVVPVILIIILTTISFVSKAEWFIYSTIILGYMLIIYQIGNWGIWSLYTRYTLPLVYVVAAVNSYTKVSSYPILTMELGDMLFQTILHVVILSSLLYYNIMIFLGRSYYEKPIRLDFPLKEGTYLIVDGGSNHLVNPHINSKYFVQNKINRSMAFAVDIQKITDLGTASKKINPKELSDYASFGETIYSPCDGVVVEVTNDVSDDTEDDFENPKGNQVIIKKDNVFIVMIHFKKASITVQEGDYVKSGQVLGQVGNSGLVKRPNLHIQAVVGSPWFGEGVPMLFDGRFLVKNDIVIKK